MRKSFQVLFCLIALFSTGCGDASQPHDAMWVDPGFGYKIPQGIYSVSYQVLDDTCSSKLSSAIEKQDLAKIAYVKHGNVDSDKKPFAHSWMFEVRDFGSISPITSEITSEGQAVFRYFNQYKYPGDIPVQCNNEALGILIASQIDTSAISEADGVFRVNFRQEWQGIQRECQEGSLIYAGSIPDEFVPTTPCVDEYDVVYTLQEECPSQCELNTRFTSMGEGEFKRSAFEKKEDWCTCPE